ncbi:NAD-binding protein [Actinoallomurus rhizosphaericola]|uniref:NAD-binding protein n=1 Tax=Actinoallomurus rhizosphaericola TaxID=2952536 RepID=UPI002091602A|nr:NAD-binding protein [Actinoallomurus rhizosphaericola]MCO5993344.1 NAD-binding protein [Actinoallomurus rhizosphaericola]
MPTVVPRLRSPVRGRLIICGDTPLAFRLADELSTRYLQDVTVIVPTRRRNHAPQISELPRVRVHEAAELNDETFRAVHVESALAVALVSNSEVGNIHAALRVQELNPDIRLVIRMSNTTLGNRIRTLFKDCAVLSDGAVAAPSFVAAALGDLPPSHVRVAGRTLYVAHRSDRVRNVICALADTRGPDGRPRLLPVDQDRANLVLAVADGTSRTSLAGPPVTSRPVSGLTRSLRLLLSRRLLQVAVALLVLILVGSAALSISDGQGFTYSLYLVLLDIAGAANPEPTLSGAAKVTQVFVTLSSLALVPAITAAVVDAVVRARLAGPLERLRDPISGHVVVVGLGEVGLRVVSQLHDLGVPVVCVEANEDAVGVPLARRLGLPIVFGDATRTETLRTAWVGTCRSVVTVTSDDITNLEAGLNARALRDNVRVVLRLFDDDLAARVHRNFKIPVSRSVSFLAAPAFAAAMMERQVIGTIPVGRSVMLIADMPIGEGSELDGRPLREANLAGEARVLALGRRGRPRFDWDFQDGYLLIPGDRLVVLATRSGIGHIRARTIGAPATGPTPPPR